MEKQMESYLWVATIILLGAIANCMQIIILDSEKKKTTIQLIANFILAAFGWIIAWLVAKLVLDDVVWICVIAGIWWYAWVQGLNKLKDVLFETLIDIIKKNGKSEY